MEKWNTNKKKETRKNCHDQQKKRPEMSNERAAYNGECNKNAKSIDFIEKCTLENGVYACHAIDVKELYSTYQSHILYSYWTYKSILPVDLIAYTVNFSLLFLFRFMCLLCAVRICRWKKKKTKKIVVIINFLLDGFVSIFINIRCAFIPFINRLHGIYKNP